MSDEESRLDETIAVTRRARRRAVGVPEVVAEPASPSAAGEPPVASEDPQAGEPAPASADDDRVDERTVVVDRRARTKRPEAKEPAAEVPGAEAPAAEVPGAEAPRAIASPPAAIDTSTPSIYRPRPAPLTPGPPPVIERAAAPTRVDDPGLPSVARQGRRWSLYAIGAVAGACVVSVVGLVALAITAIGG